MVKPTPTPTGRLIPERFDGNLRHGLRGFARVPEGRAFIDVDYSRIELRILAAMPEEDLAFFGLGKKDIKAEEEV